jgi:hypothetical protein
MTEMTIMKIAKKYGTHPAYVGLLLRMGALEGRKDPNGRWLVRTTSMEKYLQKSRRGRRSAADKQSQVEGQPAA